VANNNNNNNNHMKIQTKKFVSRLSFSFKMWFFFLNIASLGTLEYPSLYTSCDLLLLLFYYYLVTKIIKIWTMKGKWELQNSFAQHRVAAIIWIFFLIQKKKIIKENIYPPRLLYAFLNIIKIFFKTHTQKRKKTEK
jgi:hypothetical protein